MIWNDNLLTGVASIDNQHREIFDRIEKTLAAGMRGQGKNEIEETLNFLGDYVMTHFGDEERLQRESGYTDAAKHKFQHDVFISNFKKLYKDYDEHGATLNITLQVNKVIVDWLVQHINTHDLAFAKYYKSK